ncbi:MAG: MFS transporter [Pyrinomonadaceae bacterium]|nr:MFS transporter [Pyrinomonadaceae bacterium]
MVTSCGLGLLYPQMPGHIIAVSIIATHMLFAVFISASPMGEATPARGLDWRHIPSLLRSTKVWLLLSTLFLNRVASAPFYGFYTIFVQENGLSGEVVAWTWGLAVTTEIIMMLVVDRFIDRIGTTRMLAFGVCLEAARWFVYAIVQSKTALLLLAPWHGLAFTALYVASVRELAELIPARLRSLGQGLGAAANGLGQVVGLVIAGYAHQIIGNRGMFLIGGCVGLLACANALLLSYLVHRRHDTGRGGSSTSAGYGSDW